MRGSAAINVNLRLKKPLLLFRHHLIQPLLVPLTVLEPVPVGILASVFTSYQTFCPLDEKGKDMAAVHMPRPKA